MGAWGGGEKQMLQSVMDALKQGKRQYLIDIKT